MKPIISKEKQIKKQKRNQFIVGIVLVFLMLASVFGIVANSFGANANTKKVIYNGVKFTEQNGFWIAEINKHSIILSNNPREIENQDFELNPLENYYNKPLYIDSQDSIASSEIYNNLGSVIQRISFACISEESCEENMPVKTCNDNLIVIKESSETRIIQEENCVFIESPKESITKAVDIFLLRLFGLSQ